MAHSHRLDPHPPVRMTSRIAETPWCCPLRTCCQLRIEPREVQRPIRVDRDATAGAARGGPPTVAINSLPHICPLSARSLADSGWHVGGIRRHRPRDAEPCRRDQLSARGWPRRSLCPLRGRQPVRAAGLRASGRFASRSRTQSSWASRTSGSMDPGAAPVRSSSCTACCTSSLTGVGTPLSRPWNTTSPLR
jgi:hypothetical protein